jgi:ubiquinone/menaquinone biosynthesis C-methylase UbiE/uncharacterized protein YbaR (Trm112 family)
MKKEYINLLLCPVCREAQFNLMIEEENDVEIRSGEINCNKCGSQFKINRGIINFLEKPRPEVVSEQKGWLLLAKQNGIYEQEILEQLAVKLPDINTLHNQVFREHWLPCITNFNSALDRLKLKGNEKILDVGAGRCWTTKTFARFGCQSIAFDILSDKVMGLGAAESIISKKLYFERIIGDMERMPFKNESFDIVFSTASIHHSDIRKSISETARILKSGGRLVLINEPTAGENDKRLKKMEGEEVKAGIAEHVYSIADYCSVIENSGIAPRLYYPPGAIFMMKEILKNPLEHQYLRKTKLLAAVGIKAKIINRKTLPLLWRTNRLKEYFGLFLIGVKS